MPRPIVKRGVRKYTPQSMAERYRYGNLEAAHTIIADNTKPTRDAQELQHLTTLPPDAHAWVDFTTKTLKLPACYVPAAQRVIGQNNWRRLSGKGQNPLGYVKTATMREASKMGLAMDRYRVNEPRVLTKERPRSSPNSPARSTVGLVPLPGRFNWSSPEEGPGAHSAITDSDYSYVDNLDHLLEKARRREPRPDGLLSRIPHWLRRADERDAVDWEKVARFAVVKPHMAPVVAKVLALQACGLSRDRALAAVSNPKKARELQSAWRWVDRNSQARIAPLFRLEEPPAAAVSVPTEHSGFLKPADALARARARNQKLAPYITAPSLAESGRNVSVRLREWLGTDDRPCPDIALSFDGRFLHVGMPGSQGFLIDASELEWLPSEQE